jgi:hypothetical protein
VKDTPRKNPVLTSPWKIGALVALLLVVVGFGGGYYVVEVYDVELEWLHGSIGQWEVDSYTFFREAYPLVAGILLLSVISYLVVAGAVRRYRHFLDSGQDYRKMVQLADSIDDLTNPAQIAKLKKYPELQTILRNYGDQIRAISKQLNEQQSQMDHRSVDLEMEVDALLQGESTQDSLVEDRWWTPLYRKIESQLQDDQQIISALKMKVHDGKSALGRVALSTGRIIEQISGTSEEYPEILSAVNELNGVTKQLGEDIDSKPRQSARPDKAMLNTIVTEMENTLHKLAEGGKVLNEFSEENNGLALNIALIAAKGEAGEHDLAQFAEKVRSTADRFNKLSRTFTSMAQGLLGTCNTLRKKLGVEGGMNSALLDEIHRSIEEISKKIEARSNQLQERLCCIGNEIHEVQELVNKSIKGITEGESDRGSEAGPETSRDKEEGEISIDTNEAEKEEEDSDLVIDHGRPWSDAAGLGDDLVSFEKVESDGFSLDDVKKGVFAEGALAPKPESQEKAQNETGELREAEEPASEPILDEAGEVRESDEKEGSSQEVEIQEDEAQVKEYVISIGDEAAAEAESYLDGVKPDVSGGEDTAPPSAEGDEWEDMAAKEWVKIDIDKSERVDDAGPEEVTVRETADMTGEQPVDQEAPPTSEEMTERIPESQFPPEGEDGEEEQIYDLYELGAIEYVEEPLVKE